jgi:hypothetical protein
MCRFMRSAMKYRQLLNKRSVKVWLKRYMMVRAICSSEDITGSIRFASFMITDVLEFCYKVSYFTRKKNEALTCSMCLFHNR